MVILGILGKFTLLYLGFLMKVIVTLRSISLVTMVESRSARFGFSVERDIH